LRGTPGPRRWQALAERCASQPIARVGGHSRVRRGHSPPRAPRRSPRARRSDANRGLLVSYARRPWKSPALRGRGTVRRSFAAQDQDRSAPSRTAQRPTAAFIDDADGMSLEGSPVRERHAAA
jgi:hypothetical protein